MSKRMIAVGLGLQLVVLMCGISAADELMARAQMFFKPIPETAPPPKDNAPSPVKMDLGRMLYFDPRLSASGLISCNTCHNVGIGGADLQETAVGHGWQKGGRNSPTVFNAVFNLAQFWDGRAQDLKEQAKGPPQAAIEMNSTPELVVETVKSMPEYGRLFKKVFPRESNPVTYDNIAKAIEAFEASLLTPDAPFDRYLKGDGTALNAEEQAGLQVFMDKGCAGCHGGINMGGTGYFPFGVVEKPKAEITAGDTGRFKVTGAKGDEYVFKSPSLRNIALTAPYFHSGKVWSLKGAVAIMGSAQLGIALSSDEADRVVAFLKTTTGVQPRIEYPILPPSSESTPKPKLD
jgi:cytochrome c peroxidase